MRQINDLGSRPRAALDEQVVAIFVVFDLDEIGIERGDIVLEDVGHAAGVVAVAGRAFEHDLAAAFQPERQALAVARGLVAIGREAVALPRVEFVAPAGGVRMGRRRSDECGQGQEDQAAHTDILQGNVAGRGRE